MILGPSLVSTVSNSTCLTQEDCSSEEMCVGDCKANGMPDTCCVNVSVPEKPSSVLAVNGFTCSKHNLDGIYIPFSVSELSSWFYVQLGNYDSKLFQEHLEFQARICLSSMSPIAHCSGLKPTVAIPFEPPGWVLATANQGILLSTHHLAFNADGTLLCPSKEFDNSTSQWTCYDNVDDNKFVEFGPDVALISQSPDIANVSFSCENYTDIRV